jgi:hypothetical protein
MSLDKAFANVRAFVTNKALEPGWDDDEQIVASAPWGGVDCLITIGDLRELIEAHLRGRWNVDEKDSVLLICRGLHDKADACEIERYVPEATGLGDGSKTAEYLDGRMKHWLGEAQRLAELVRTLGGDPEPGAVQPVVLDDQKRARPAASGFPAAVISQSARRLTVIEEDWNSQESKHPDPGEISFLIRLARAYIDWPTVDDLARERAEICRALGCVDKPGVPLEFILKLIQGNGDMHHRIVELIRSWDPATPTERQELDRMRRGWGPSTPTERNRRHQDVLGCLSVLSGALADLAAPDEGEGEIPEAASEYIDAAYERLDKRHNEMLAICNSLDIEPMEWPDIMAAEERGAMAMRLILEHSVKGLRVMPEKLMADTHQNIGIAKALGAIERAPLPHYYDGSGLDDVAEILALREDNDESGARKARRERDAWKKHAAENAIAADRLARACFNAREALKPFAAIEPDTGAVLPREVYEAAVAAVKDPGLIEPVSQSRLLAALRIVERQDNGWDPKLVGADRLSKARPGDVTINVPTARCWLQFEPGSSTGTDELTRPGVGFTLVAYPDSSGEWPCGVIPRDEASKLHQMLQTFLEKHPVEAPR